MYPPDSFDSYSFWLEQASLSSIFYYIPNAMSNTLGTLLAVLAAMNRSNINVQLLNNKMNNKIVETEEITLSPYGFCILRS